MLKKSIKDFKVRGEKVILRVDFNVPINKNGVITNDKRIQEALPTIQYLIENKAKIIIISHLGRPHGKPDEAFSLKPVADYLRKILDTNVFFSGEILGEETTRFCRLLNEGEILVLENIRFMKEEEENNLEFAEKLAQLGSIYCLDAFGTAHRAHASIDAITNFLPSCCGLLMHKELNMMDKLIENPERPFVVVLGGSKIKDKISLVNHLINKVDKLIIGGAMAFTFLRAKDIDVGNSLVDEGKIELARLLLAKAEAKKVEILLPVDLVVAEEFSFLANYDVYDIKKIPLDGIGMDIGPKTCKIYSKALKNAKTIFWNGPMGVFEFKRFSKGTNEIAKAISENKHTTIVGGGDSAAAVISLGLEKDFTHISTGGGASLTYLEGDTILPGLKNIEEKGEPFGARMHLNIINDLKNNEDNNKEQINLNQKSESDLLKVENEEQENSNTPIENQISFLQEQDKDNSEMIEQEKIENDSNKELEDSIETEIIENVDNNSIIIDTKENEGNVLTSDAIEDEVLENQISLDEVSKSNLEEETIEENFSNEMNANTLEKTNDETKEDKE